MEANPRRSGLLPEPGAQPPPEDVTFPANLPAMTPREPRPGRSGPQGMITRGTTNPNRLRRVDRWLAGPQAFRLRRASRPVVVDLGYGATGVTAVELHNRLRQVRPDVEVVGI